MPRTALPMLPAGMSTVTVHATLVGGPEDGNQRVLPYVLPAIKVPIAPSTGVRVVFSPEELIPPTPVFRRHLYVLAHCEGAPSRDDRGRYRYQYVGEQG